MKYKFS